MSLYDKDIRKILIREFTNISQFTSDKSTVIINELDVCFGSAIMDIAVVNGKMHGYEIKSERDTLERLSTQKLYYNLVFDTITLVISSKHLKKALKETPIWWGIYCITATDNNNYTLEVIREPDQNTSIDTFSLSQILWKHELIELLNTYGISKGLKSKTRRELGNIVSNSLNVEKVKEYVRFRLKNRSSWKAYLLQQLYDEKPHLLPN